MNRKALTAGLVAVLYVLLGAWIAGMDFGERGGPALFVYLLASFLFAATYCYPGFHNKENNHD